MRSIRIIAVFTCLLGASIVPSPTPIVATAAPLAQTNTDFATVYVYRIDQDYVPQWFYTWNLTVYFGAQPDAKGNLPRLARVKNNRYFVMHVPAGKYFFDTHRMKDNLPVEFAAGAEYYFLLDAGKDCGVYDPTATENCNDRWPSIEAVDAVTGKAALPHVTLIGSDNVKNRNLVALPGH